MSYTPKASFTFNNNPHNEEALRITQRYWAQGGTEHDPLPEWMEPSFSIVRFTLGQVENNEER